MDPLAHLSVTAMDDVPLQYENPDDFWPDTKATIVDFALLPPEDRPTMKSVCDSIFSAAASITSALQENSPIWDSKLVSQALDCLWFEICWAGMTRHPVFEQQQLVHLVGILKNLGTIPKDSPSGGSSAAVVGVVTVNWTELPGLQTAMMEMLRDLSQGSYTESPHPAEHWKNLHTLAARLSASGICSDLRSCAVWALRSALEEEVEDNSRVSPTMMQRLEVVEIWLRSHGLWLESVVCHSKITKTYSLNEDTVLRYEPASSSSFPPPGPLAVGAGITGDDGISWERWEFWRSRLSTIMADVDEYGQLSKVSTQARALLRYLATIQ